MLDGNLPGIFAGLLDAQSELPAFITLVELVENTGAGSSTAQPRSGRTWKVRSAVPEDDLKVVCHALLGPGPTDRRADRRHVCIQHNPSEPGFGSFHVWVTEGAAVAAVAAGGPGAAAVAGDTGGQQDWNGGRRAHCGHHAAGEGSSVAGGGAAAVGSSAGHAGSGAGQAGGSAALQAMQQQQQQQQREQPAVEWRSLGGMHVVQLSSLRQAWLAPEMITPEIKQVLDSMAQSALAEAVAAAGKGKYTVAVVVNCGGVDRVDAARSLSKVASQRALLHLTRSLLEGSGLERGTHIHVGWEASIQEPGTGTDTGSRRLRLRVAPLPEGVLPPPPKPLRHTAPLKSAKGIVLCRNLWDGEKCHAPWKLWVHHDEGSLLLPPGRRQREVVMTLRTELLFGVNGAAAAVVKPEPLDGEDQPQQPQHNGAAAAAGHGAAGMAGAADGGGGGGGGGAADGGGAAAGGPAGAAAAAIGPGGAVPAAGEAQAAAAPGGGDAGAAQQPQPQPQLQPEPQPVSILVTIFYEFQGAAKRRVYFVRGSVQSPEHSQVFNDWLTRYLPPPCLWMHHGNALTYDLLPPEPAAGAAAQAAAAGGAAAAGAAAGGGGGAPALRHLHVTLCRSEDAPVAADGTVHIIDGETEDEDEGVEEANEAVTGADSDAEAERDGDAAAAGSADAGAGAGAGGGAGLRRSARLAKGVSTGNGPGSAAPVAVAAAAEGATDSEQDEQDSDTDDEENETAEGAAGASAAVQTAAEGPGLMGAGRQSRRGIGVVGGGSGGAGGDAGRSTGAAGGGAPGGGGDADSYSVKITPTMRTNKFIRVSAGLWNAPNGVLADLFNPDMRTPEAREERPLPTTIRLLPRTGHAPGTVWTAKASKEEYNDRGSKKRNECFLEKGELQGLFDSLNPQIDDRVCFRRIPSEPGFSYHVWVVRCAAIAAAAATAAVATAAAAAGPVAVAAATAASAAAAEPAAAAVVEVAAVAAVPVAAVSAVPAAMAAAGPAAGGAAAEEGHQESYRMDVELGTGGAPFHGAGAAAHTTAASPGPSGAGPRTKGGGPAAAGAGTASTAGGELLQAQQQQAPPPQQPPKQQQDPPPQQPPQQQQQAPPPQQPPQQQHDPPPPQLPVGTLNPHRFLPPETAAVPPDWTSLPPLQEGQLRVIGLTFPQTAAPAASAHAGAWLHGLLGRPLGDVPAYEQVFFDALTSSRLEQLGFNPFIIADDVAEAVGIAANQDAVLAAHAPPPLYQLARGWDEQRRCSVAEAAEVIPEGRAIAVLPGCVMPAAEADEFSENGHEGSSLEMRAVLRERSLRMCPERERGRAGATILRHAWRQLATHTMSDYPALDAAAPAGAPAGAAGMDAEHAAAAAAAAAGGGWRLSQLGYGGLAALVTDPRVHDSQLNPTSQGSAQAAADAAAKAGANCEVVFIHIRGLPHPVLISLRDIKAREGLATYQDPAWWNARLMKVALAMR
ncbi:hypothetical protein HXX76_011724 [Chlamydomonas incerta]|uniref:Uncharacterized protein n=1 Tax=Chlamydomonas incerta TaxID=51695 RepID=A0A835STJ3_CHLIN|nr:hypothetical protein HXX76_011724 [Chlamydomonas incerta]|eukprot:KAG2426495.1 hypothetical protein HXX76_011724 [Chlamydomonas incerta]